MSSPPASPSSRKRAEAKAAAAASSAKTSARKESPASSAVAAGAAKPGAKDIGKPKTKKELEADRLAAEEAEKRKPPATGSGLFEFPNGAVYEGEWQEFESASGGGAPSKKRHGQGRWSNGGETYAGSWIAGEIGGRGKYTFSSGATYDGEWVANKFQGRGTYVWPAASSESQQRAMYIGDWVDNKMHGVGAFLAATGDRYQGVFQNDRFQNAQGHWIAPMQEAGNKQTAQTK